MRGSEANAAAWVSAEEPAARVDGVEVDAEVDILGGQRRYVVMSFPTTKYMVWKRV